MAKLLEDEVSIRHKYLHKPTSRQRKEAQKPDSHAALLQALSDTLRVRQEVTTTLVLSVVDTNTIPDAWKRRRSGSHPLLTPATWRRRALSMRTCIIIMIDTETPQASNSVLAAVSLGQP